MAPGLRKKLPSTRVQQSSNMQNPISLEQSNGFSPNHGTDASSNQDTSQINNESESVPTSKKRGRGPTRGKELQRMNDVSKKKLEVCIDSVQGRPLDKVQSAKLSSEIGIVSREFMLCPVSFPKFSQDDRNVAYDQVNMRLNIPGLGDVPRVTETVNTLLSNRFRNRRYNLHKYYKTFDSDDQARQKKPEKVTEQQWTDLCDYWSQPHVKEKCKKAAESRKQMKTPHNQGTKAFVVVRHEISKKLDNGQVCDRITFYKHTHYNEATGKWTSSEAEENYKRMIELLTKSTEEGAPLSDDEICDIVLGTRSGCIKGLGYGPKPARSIPATSSLIQELQEKLRQSKAENDQLKERLENEIEKGQRREEVLTKHELLFRRLLGPEYDNETTVQEEEDYVDA